MGLESVVKGILEAGRREAEEIVSGGKKEASGTIAEAKKKGTEEMRRRVQEAEVLGEKRRVQDLARADLEVKRIALEAQKEILDLIYSEALERLRVLPSNDAVLRRLLSAHMADVRTGRVHSNERDRMTVQSIVGESYAGTRPVLGGVVIESIDGKTTVDLTYETMMQKTWEDSVREVAQVLWR